MLQFRIVHCIQDVGKQVLDEEERGITKQLRILDQGNCIAFAIIGDYAFCRIRLELLIVLWIVLINDIAYFCRVAVVVAIDFILYLMIVLSVSFNSISTLEETLIVPLDFLELTFDRNISFA